MAAQSCVGRGIGVSGKEKILFLAREFTKGGAAFLALRHIRRLQSRYDIDFLVTGPCDDEMIGLLPEGIELFRLNATPIQSDSEAIDALAELLNRKIIPLLRSYRALLATSVLTDWHACAVVGLARAGRKLVFVVDELAVPFANLPYHVQRGLEYCLLQADIVLPVSEAVWAKVKANVPAAFGRKWEILRPPIDTGPAVNRSLNPQSRAWPTGGRPAVLTVARLVPDKGIYDCLRLHHRLHGEGVEFDWFVVGTGSQEQELEAAIDSLGMSGRFVLLGERADVYQLMRECDLFVLLSKSEGCPTVVIEAMSLGRPVLMTDVNGAAELIEHMKTGVIAPCDPEKIAGLLRKLIMEPDFRETIEKNLAKREPVADAAREISNLIEKIEAPERIAPGLEPEVSILIPAYNHERFLEHAVASALMQDFASLEVIVADDASTDRTPLIAEMWRSDPRFHYHRSKENLGRTANYRHALHQLARGKWALTLDGDDHLTDPAFISVAWDSVQRHGGDRVAFAMAGHRVCKWRTDWESEQKPPIAGEEEVLNGGEYLKLLFATGFFTHLGALYNRPLAMAHHFYSAEISSSDMESFLRLALEGDVVLLNRIAGCWVQHGANASSNLPLHRIAENVVIFRRIARTAEERGLLRLTEIEADLTGYEAHTLGYLFLKTLGKSATGPLDLMKMIRIARSVNPRTVMHRRIIQPWMRHGRQWCREAMASLEQQLRDSPAAEPIRRLKRAMS